jgi:hypothetical protein
MYPLRSYVLQTCPIAIAKDNKIEFKKKKKRKDERKRKRRRRRDERGLVTEKQLYAGGWGNRPRHTKEVVLFESNEVVRVDTR